MFYLWNLEKCAARLIVALNLFDNFFVSVLYIASWLFSYRFHYCHQMKTIATSIIVPLSQGGRVITTWRAIKRRSKELIPKMKQRWWLKAITLQGTLEKSLKNNQFNINNTKIILYFGCTNSIFIYCNS